MLAIIYERQGQPKDVLQVVDLPTPTPTGNQVLVQVEAAPIEPADLAVVRGVYRTPQTAPTIPGLEACGRIVALGPDAKHYQVGQRVMALPFKSPGWTNGTWQQFWCIEETELFPVPDVVDSATWSQFFITILTPWVMAVEEFRLSQGQNLLVTGAGSTVGQVLIQISRLMQFNFIGVVRRPEQVQEILALGASHVICSSTEDITQRAMALTQLQGVNAVVDAVGGTVTSQCFRALADNGKMFVYGLLALERESAIDIRKMLFYNLSLQGFWLPGWWDKSDPQYRLQVTQNAASLVAQGYLTAPVDSIFSARDVKEAVIKAESPGNKGRVILSFMD